MKMCHDAHTDIRGGHKLFWTLSGIDRHTTHTDTYKYTQEQDLLCAYLIKCSFLLDGPLQSEQEVLGRTDRTISFDIKRTS
jgi:hypothetical protein